MNDRELLEMAAKAAKSAGVELVVDPFGVTRNCVGFLPEMNIFAAPAWRPLSDDGDALRLAVQLNIEIHLDLTVGTVNTAFVIGRLGYNTSEEVNENGDCPYAAARRAIVRAAAAIGEAMP